jgi:hypothetical protein
LRRELERLGEPRDVRDEHVARARAEAWRAHLFASADPASLAFSLADEWALADSERFFTAVDELYDIDAADVEQFARSYLRGQPRVVTLMSNEETINAQGLYPSVLAEALP